MVPLGGVDAVVFTGGIGEKSWIKRAKILGEQKYPKRQSMLERTNDGVGDIGQLDNGTTKTFLTKFTTLLDQTYLLLWASPTAERII